MRARGLVVATCVGLAGAAAAETGHRHAPYAGQQTREIKSLSAQDVDDLLAGRGWGLAKAAELNGLPGPAHLLEMRKQIGLTADQTARIQVLYDDMNREARRLGKWLVDLERDLDRAFAERSVEEAALRAKLDKIAEVRGQLRYVHLKTHLQTPAILTAQQVKAYNRLRGYAANDPCATPPKGHDPAMWRKHNGCE